MLGPGTGVHPAHLPVVVLPAVLELEHLAARLQTFPQRLAHRLTVGRDHPVTENRGGGRPADHESGRDIDTEQVGVDGVEQRARPEPHLPGHHHGRLQGELEAVPLHGQRGALRARGSVTSTLVPDTRTTTPSSPTTARPFTCTHLTSP